MAPMGAKAQPEAKKAAAKPKSEPKKPKEPKEPKEDDTPKVDQPDRAAFEEKLQKIQHDIDAFQKQQGACTAKIHERSGGKDEFFAKKAELRAQLDPLSAKMNELQAKKEGILKVMGDKKQEGMQMRDDLKKMKKTIGFTNEADIDARIKAIEYKMHHESVHLKEEKKMMIEIQELKKSKPKVSQVQQAEAKLDSFDPGVNMKEQMQTINSEKAQLYEAKKAIQEQITELMEGRKDQLGDMPQVIEERDALGKKIQEKIQERNQLRDEFRQAEREFNNYLGEQRRARQERAGVERQQRQAEYDLARLQREAEKLDDQPHVAEITLIEQTIAFCNSLTQSKVSEQKEAKKETAAAKPADGMEVLIRKEDREEEFFFAPLKSKKAVKSKSQGGKAAAGKSIKHNAETFRLFDQLKLDAPITTDDIPALLVKLEEQLAEYKVKVETWEEKREEMKRKILEGGVIEKDDAAEKQEDKAEEGKED